MWAGLVIYFFLPIVQSCTKGKPNECAEVNFAPGSNLAGEGYDVTKMQRKGAFVIDMNVWRQNDKSCSLCKNPYMEGANQKLPTSVVDWRASKKCSIQVSSSLYQSSEELVSSSTSSIENNWGANLGIETDQNTGGKFILAGTKSKLAEYSMEKTKKDKYNFASQSVSCSFYSYRVSNLPVLHPEFKRSVKELPKIYNLNFKKRFYKFINTYGTHYITKVTLGGSVNSVTSIRQCETALQGLSTDEVKTCLDVEASASVLGKVDMKAETKHCNEDKDKTESKSSFSSRFNDRLTEVTGGHTTEPELLFSGGKDPSAYKEWLESLPQNPDMLSYSLESLHELISKKDPVRKHLRQAIHDYILEKSLLKNCSDCKDGVKTNPNNPCVCTCHNNPGITPDCCPSKRGLSRVTVTIVRAQDLWGDTTTETDGYVKVFDKNKLQVGRTDMIINNNSPYWGRTFDLGDVVLAENDKIKLEVWDEDNKWNDDLLGTCEVPIKAGQNSNFCTLNHGLLFYKTEVTCAPSLSGPYCANYVGSPMNFHLEKTYVSRNARPVPAEILMSKGVLLDRLYVYQKTNYSAKTIL
ncbi:perforin-1-like [Carassius carassius]|uniref:perforin-1-like n=1 Tax=Carassius carassius TaxID=217509 RepID=UPI0028690A2D|nr:perforin-1-like [Carassius carassius]